MNSFDRVKYIHTKGGVTVVIDGEPVTISVNEKVFNDVLSACQLGKSEYAVNEIINGTKNAVIEQLHIQTRLRYDNGVVTHNGKPLHGYAVEKLIQLVHTGLSVISLAKFLERTELNPSSTVVEHLYKFLEHGNMPITEDGCFLAYKAVRQDFKDIHSGQFDNSIGQWHRIPRNNVDDRRDMTCSFGFHVCSFDYLPHFSHADGHVVICKVSQADVVAIPSDYNDTKMRVCAYSVIGEVPDWYANQRNMLADDVVATEYVVIDIDTDETVATFYYLSDAEDFVETSDRNLEIEENEID